MSTIIGTDGNDSVTVTGGTTVADTMYYNVDLGAGVDTLTLDYRTMLQGVALSSDLVTGDQNCFVTGKAESYIPLLDATHFEYLNFLGGQGDDDVFVHENLQGGLIATGAGNDLIQYSGVGQTAIDGGTGHDTLYIDDLHLPADSAQWNLTINGIEDVSAHFQTEHDLVIDQAHFGADLGYLTLECSGAVSIDGYFAERNDLYANVFFGGADDTLVLDYRGLKAGVAFFDYGGGAGNGNGISYQGEEHLTILSGELGDYFYFSAPSIQLNIVSGGGDDVFSTGSADDSISAGSGNDYIEIGGGRDTVDGGSGNDSILINSNFLPGIGAAIDEFGDFIFGGYGNDTIRSATADDTISGGMGNDAIADEGGSNSISGGAGDDYIISSGIGDTIDGGSGSDEIRGEGGNALIFGGYGNDYIELSPGTNSTIDGGAGNDTVVGLDAQLIYGGDGNDVLGGCDSIFGGNGNDTINIGWSDVALASEANGGAGDDAISTDGFFLDDTIYGGSGNDTITGSGSVYAGIGNDQISIKSIDTGELHSSEVYAGPGDDCVTVLSVNKDTIYGGIGNDVIDARAGFQDLIDGGFGNDKLLGSSSADKIFGGLGMDTIAGGAGADELMGGKGADWFVFDSAQAADNVDTLVDFISGVDHLLLDDAVFAALGVAGVETGTALPAELFHAGTVASDVQQRVIFDRDSGALYYDADGSGSGEAVQIALIAGNTALLNAGDFLIV